MNNSALKELVAIKRLLAILATKNESRREQIIILNDAGFKPAEIASLVDTTANTVSVTLYQAKKVTRKKK